MTPLRQERNLSSPLFLSRFPRVALFPAAIIAASICAPGRGRRKNAVPASGCHAWAEPGTTRHSHKRGPVAHCASSPEGRVRGEGRRGLGAPPVKGEDRGVLDGGLA